MAPSTLQTPLHHNSLLELQSITCKNPEVIYSPSFTSTSSLSICDTHSPPDLTLDGDLRVCRFSEKPGVRGEREREGERGRDERQEECVRERGIERQRWRQTEKQTDRQTDRRSVRETEGETEAGME